jgi:hypothetical protein
MGLQAPFWVLAALVVAPRSSWPTFCSSSRLLERRYVGAPAGRPYGCGTTTDNDSP